jgi:hypothetical protein
MKLTNDTRGVSEVVGAILVFGVLVALLAVMQTQAIPAANEQVEYNHNQEVQGDLVQFQTAASRTAAQGTTESVGIRMGTTYPSRLLFFNPRNPSGNIRTVGNQSAKIENIEATDGTISKYIDGDMTNLETKRVEYEPNYNEYRSSPTTVLEYGFIYDDYGNDSVIEDPGSIINGNSINLMFFGGNLSRSQGGSLSLNARPTSAPARTVTVQPKNQTQNVTIQLPTGLPPEQWENILSDEIQNGNVEQIRDGPGSTVILVLDGDVNRYTIRTPKIGVGSSVAQPEPAYVIGVDGTVGTVPRDSVRDITFEVRDKYNNPVRGEQLNVSLETGAQGDITENSIRTDNEGQATVRYESPDISSTPQTEDIKVSFARDPANSSSNFNSAVNPEDFTFEITIVDRELPTGDAVVSTINVDGASCRTTSDGGLLGTTLLGSEATELNISWTASIDGSEGELRSANIEMIDQDNGQLASSTYYNLDGDSAGESLTMMDRRKNDNSCDKNYKVIITATSEGNRIDSAEDTISSGDIN